MHGWLAVLNLLPTHLLLSQLPSGESSSMSKGELLSDVLPLMMFPVGQFPETVEQLSCMPGKLLLSVVLAWISLVFPVTKIPPELLLPVLLMTLLLLLLTDIVSLTSLRTRSQSLAPVRNTMPAEVSPGSRTTFPSSFHWLEDPWMSKPKPVMLPIGDGQLAVTVTNFTKEPAEFSARKPFVKLVIVPVPRTRTMVNGVRDEVPLTWIPLLLLQVPGVAVPLIVWPFRCSVTLLAVITIPSAPAIHGPTFVPREYSPG
jgi:hypothetical protein